MSRSPWNFVAAVREVNGGAAGGDVTLDGEGELAEVVVADRTRREDRRLQV